MRKTIIISLIALITIITVILALNTSSKLSDLTVNILIGIYTSSIVVLILEIITFLKNSNRYGFLNKKYKRIKIYNKLSDKKNDTIYEEITSRYHENNINSLIKIKHHGDGRFSGSAYYEEGKVKFDVFLDSTNPSFGLGTYQYIEKYKNKDMPDLGKLELVRDKVDDDKIYIYFKNIAPSGLAESYEIWEVH